MRLVIVHYHFRPGGIRRVIELATPHLRRALGADTVELATGEPADPLWDDRFRKANPGCRVAWVVEPAFRYLSEQRGASARILAGVRRACERLLADADETVVWAHNLGIGRNVILARELTLACERRGVPLVSHHHDWWFENRWQRWPEMRRTGLPNLRVAAAVIFAANRRIRHVAINHADARVLRRRLGPRAAWLPNLSDKPIPPRSTAVTSARDWLARTLGERAPVWLLPCRLLRRKNVAEAVLLGRWLRPEALLVTTGGVSSADEAAYGNRLFQASREHGWRLRLSVLAGDERAKPSVPELLAASECVLLTSILEGFGLPYIEAAAAGRPLVARRLPNIAPDLARFGFRFPQSYTEVRVATGLFDWRAEQRRQQRFYRAWKAELPASCRRLAGEPLLLASDSVPVAVPFSRLTLTAQLEVLRWPAEESWAACAGLNPFLRAWRGRAADRCLQPSAWPESAEAWLGGEAYGRRFVELLAHRPGREPDRRAAWEIQQDFLRVKLGSEHQFPLLWRSET